MTNRLSHAMHGALEFVRAGVAPGKAAAAAGVSTAALYRAMRREGVSGNRPRCPTCGHIVAAAE